MRAGITLVLAALVLSACGRSDDTPADSIKDRLGACSPFETLDHKQSLYFYPSKRVDGERVAAGESKGVGDTTNKTTTEGTYSVNQDAETVSVVFSGGSSTYQYVDSGGIEGCMLIVGSKTSADLTRSWFSMQGDEGDDSDAQDNY